jgi:D-3-phosphoglycerate dehydrogenase
MALILALARNLPWAFDHVRKGGWDRDQFRGRQLLGKTLGLIGFGRLGKIVAKYAKAFGQNVIAHDPYVPPKVFKRLGVKRVDLKSLLKNSDIVSLHAAHTPETDKLLKEEHFRLMKPAAYFVNTARGEIIDENSLLKALQNKWIAGAALDVMTAERGDASHLRNNPLLRYSVTHNNLLIVPHLGGATFEAMQITEDFVADLVKKFFKR